MNPDARIPNAEQQAVIDELTENVILFASAGTGKTFSVARRVGRILDAGLAEPGEILCLTFTIKASDEMKEDISVYAGEKARGVNVSTIHSFCFQAIREEFKATEEAAADPTVCDDADECEILKDILLSMGIRSPREEERGISVLHSPVFLPGFISKLKQRREQSDLYTGDPARDYQRAYEALLEELKVNKLFSFYDKTARQKGVDGEFVRFASRDAGRFATAYDDVLRQSGRVDFDDIVCVLHRHWKKGEWLERWRERYKFIFIDEMQDTSVLEYDTLSRIFPGRNVMLCGDFFQTIYEWRHSDPVRVLTSFTDEFHPRRFMFQENYRSTRNLVGASFGYLKNTFPDLLGRYCPESIRINSGETGDRITLVRTPSCEVEAAWIYRYLLDRAPEDPTRVCVMARTNGYIGSLAERLDRVAEKTPADRRLRFFTVDKDYRFYKRPMIKDILAFYGILLNGQDAAAMTRIVEKYCRGIGPAAVARFKEQTSGASLTAYLSPVCRRTGDPYDALVKAAEAGNVVIYDTETTGLDLEKDHILQISAVRIGKDGRITDTLDQLVIPTVEISRGALETHHKSYEDIVRGGGTDALTALKRFSAFADGAVLVGHNSLRFDAPLVRRQLAECGLPRLNVIAEYDTMIIAQQFIPESVNYKLDTLCERFGVTNAAAHDALGDITATGAVLTRLLRDFIIPRTEERVAFLKQYHDRLEKFSLFVDGLREQLRSGDLRSMTETIIRTLNPAKRYPAKSAAEALSDLLLSLPAEPVREPELYLRDYLNDASLSGSQMDLLIRKLHKIPIISVHQSKGCEFDTVIIAGADEKYFPLSLSVQDGAEEEEKRVFYVAITRAKKQLILTYSATNDLGKRISFSPYLRNLPPEYCRSITV